MEPRTHNKFTQECNTTLEGTTDAYLEVDADGRCTYLNPRGERLFHIAQAQIVGEKLSEAIPDMATCAGESPHASAAEAKAHYQERYCAANRKWLAVHTHPSADGVSMYFHDISDRIANRIALRESEARLQRAQRVAHIGSWDYDLRGSVLNMSEEMHRILGITLGTSATYRSFLTLVHAEDRRNVRQAVREMLRTDGPREAEFRIQRADGEVIVARGLGEATINDDGSVASMFGVIQDISDYKRSEERAQAALIEKVKAQTANKAKSQFLANMSHELRTPLNAVIGYSEMLEEDAEMDGHKQYADDLRKINSAGRHLLQLVNDVLDLAKIEADRMDLYLEEISVGSMIDDIAVTMEPIVTKNNNRLQLDCAADVDVIQADANKVRQTLMNLLSNAAKFTSDGTVSLKAWSECEEGDPWIVFEVSDTGIGIAVEQLGRLFRPFAQADASTTRRYGGTGLGLTISKQFIEMMGGRIEVHSIVGQGTRFTVRLPAIVQGQESDGSAASQMTDQVTKR